MNLSVSMQIMQQAYAQANEVVMIATKQAQEILDNATNDANNIRMGAMQYTDDILKNLESTISHAMDSSKARSDAYMSTLQGFLDVVTTNRAELNPTADIQEETQTDTQRVTTDHARTAVIRVISSLKIPYFLMERPVPLIIELVCARPEHPPKAVKVMASK